MSTYSIVISAVMVVATGVCSGVSTCSMAAEPAPAARDTPQGELHNAVAKVIYPNRIDPNGLRDPSIQAQLEPGPFTIPKGYVFTKLRYHFSDPKTGFEHDKITATTIYSVTERRYIKEAKDNPDIILPAGDYKVVCGGLPEATGVLTYTLIREDLVKKTDDVVKTPPTKTPDGKPTTDDLSKTRVPIGPGGEEVLLNLPKAFDVVCTQAYVAPVGGSDVGRGNFGYISAEKPLLFRFRNGTFTAENRSVTRDEKNLETTWQLRLSGLFQRGIMTGDYLSYQTLADFNDPQRPAGFLCSKWWGKGKIAGQANADGKLKIIVSDFAMTSKAWYYGTSFYPGTSSVRITPISKDWEDNSSQFQDQSKSNLVLELQLPVGELQSSQKFVPEVKVPPIPQME